MHPDLVVTAYRHHERELEQALERRRAALDRASGATGATSVRTRASARAGIAAALHRLAQVARDARAEGRAVVGGSTGAECCSPA